MINNYHIDTATSINAKHNQRICGDASLTHKVKEEDRLISILADGLGSGVSANILATMTTTMALEFTKKGESIPRTANFIMQTLPEDPIRKASYSTFTILDINHEGKSTLVEYGNPRAILWRNGECIEFNRAEEKIHTQQKRFAKIYHHSFILEKDDRIILLSDGITQSGMSTQKFPFGWTLQGVKDFIVKTIQSNPNISANQLAIQVSNRAIHNDKGELTDDASVSVFHNRIPRKMVVISGPPFHETSDKLLVEKLCKFEGLKAICGGTTSKIIARELNSSIEVDLQSIKPGSPPTSKINGIDLVTEGILTLGKTSELLQQETKAYHHHEGGAAQLTHLMLSCDEILFIAGTKINNAHQDPNLPIELEIRRNVIKKIALLLEEKHFKKTTIEYI